MVGGSSRGKHRVVATPQEGVRPGAAQLQGRFDDTNLAMLQGLQCLPSGSVVHRAPVVRVDQAVVPQLGALIDVGHAGHSQREQLLAQRVVFGVRLELVDKLGQLHGHRSVQHRVQPAVHRGLELGVRVVPGGVRCRFADRLLGVAVQPLPQFVGDFAVGRPHPENVLPQEQSGRVVGGRSQDFPTGDEFHPQRRHLRQHPDAGPDVFAAFGVVGGQRRHRLGPQSRAGGGGLVELRGADAEPLRLTADFVERDQAGVAIKQAVLHRLGGHRATQLLQPGARFAAGGESGGQYLQRRTQLRCGGFGFGQRIGHQRRQPSVIAAVDVDVTEQCGHRRREVAGGRCPPPRRWTGAAGPFRCPACRWPRSP